MRVNTHKTLEFDQILTRLSNLAISPAAKDKLLSLTPFMNEGICKDRVRETTQGRDILELAGTPPLSSMKELDRILELAHKGSMLVPEQLASVREFVYACKRMRSYLKKQEISDISVASFGNSFYPLDELFEEIDRSIRNNAVDDQASPTLRDIRRRIENAHVAIKVKLESILSAKKSWFADGYVATRNGRFVLPVKKEYKNQVSGSVIDMSGSGGTYFIEPTAVRKLQDNLSLLQIDEDNEVRRILYTLTVLVEGYSSEIRINMECMETLDIIFAKAKLSLEMKAIPAEITTDRRLIIKQGRHPLLNPDSCVPLDFDIGNTIDGQCIHGVVITGPNTGGKTVALKTVGILSLMAQSGLHVPVLEGSVFCMYSSVLCDIGDGQSISENLSTFSSHITNIVEILNNVTVDSLVLLDELGSGTDPAEGMGIAVSILDELKTKGCFYLATTHYPEIKDYAMSTNGLINARMEFDRESLKPLYKLQIGQAGESCALYIAKRLGFPTHMLKRAYNEAYGVSKRDRDNKSDLQLSSMLEDDSSHIIITPAPKSAIQKATERPKQTRSQRFNIGDSVMVYPQKSVGIIYKRTNELGELGVQIKGKKQLVNHKRIKLLAPADMLYPDDYDFSIIFDSVANRKARHKMTKGHDPSLIISYDREDL